MIGSVYLFCLLFRWGILHMVLLVVGWCQVLYSNGSLWVSSHYLTPPRVSSLVVLGFCSQCSHSKASGLDLEFCVGAYIFFSAGQVLLSALSWCSECTSVSEGVFLRCLWREMYSISTYSPAILFSPKLNFHTLENRTFFFFVWNITRKNGTYVFNISFILIETLHWKYDCCFNLS